jgi:hypothetical protein
MLVGICQTLTVVIFYVRKIILGLQVEIHQPLEADSFITRAESKNILLRTIVAHK